MYITVKSLKRNLGFKGIEISDILIGFPLITIVILIFTLSSYKMLAIVLFMIGIFLLLPLNVSKKNRMYKIIILIASYLYRTKRYLYSNKKLGKERKVYIDEIKRKFKY